MRFIGGNDGMVFVGETDERGRIIASSAQPLGIFEWGKANESALLWRALLARIGANEALYRRAAHMAELQGNWWKKDEPWTKTDTELMAVVKQLEINNADIARARAQQRELPVIPRVSNPAEGYRHKGGMPSSGYGGNDTAPDRKR